MKHKSIRGTIRYTSNKPERLGQERGREYFIFTDQADGVRVMHAHCEIDDAPMDVPVCLFRFDNSSARGTLNLPRHCARERRAFGPRRFFGTFLPKARDVVQE